MNDLCKIEEVAEQLDVPVASLKTAAENHGFIYRFGDDCLRIHRDEILDLKRLVDKEAAQPTIADRLDKAVARLKLGYIPPDPTPRSRVIDASTRREVMERDGEVCAYCQTTDGPFHLDHITPFSKGGENTADNLTVSCQFCNISKGSKSLDDWRGNMT